MGILSVQWQMGSHHGDVRYPRREPPTECYHQSLFEAQPRVTELVAAMQRLDLCDDFLGVGEGFPSEAADPPALRFE